MARSLISGLLQWALVYFIALSEWWAWLADLLTIVISLVLAFPRALFNGGYTLALTVAPAIVNALSSTTAGGGEAVFWARFMAALVDVIRTATIDLNEVFNLSLLFALKYIGFMRVYVPMALALSAVGMLVTPELAHEAMPFLDTGYCWAWTMTEFVRRVFVEVIDEILRTVVPPLNQLLHLFREQIKTILYAMYNIALRVFSIYTHLWFRDAAICSGAPTCEQPSTPSLSTQCVQFEIRCLWQTFYDTVLDMFEVVLGAFVGESGASLAVTVIRNWNTFFQYAFEAAVYPVPAAQPAEIGSNARMINALELALSSTAHLANTIVNIFVTLPFLKAIFDFLKEVIPTIVEYINEGIAIFNDLFKGFIGKIITAITVIPRELCGAAADLWIIGKVISSLPFCRVVTALAAPAEIFKPIEVPVVFTAAGRRLLFDATTAAAPGPGPVAAYLSRFPHHATLLNRDDPCIPVLDEAIGDQATHDMHNTTVYRCTARLIGYDAVARMQKDTGEDAAVPAGQYHTRIALREILHQTPESLVDGTSCKLAMSDAVHSLTATGHHGVAHYVFCTGAHIATGVIRDSFETYGLSRAAAMAFVPTLAHHTDAITGEASGPIGQLTAITMRHATAAACDDLSNPEQCQHAGVADFVAHIGGSHRELFDSHAPASDPAMASRKETILAASPPSPPRTYFHPVGIGAAEHARYEKIHNMAPTWALLTRPIDSPAFVDAIRLHGVLARTATATATARPNSTNWDNTITAKGIVLTSSDNRTRPTHGDAVHVRSLLQAPSQTTPTIRVFPGIDDDIREFLLSIGGGVLSILRYYILAWFSDVFIFIGTFDYRLPGLGQLFYNLLIRCDYAPTPAKEMLRWTPGCLWYEWYFPPRFLTIIMPPQHAVAYEELCVGGLYTDESRLLPNYRHTYGLLTDPQPLPCHCATRYLYCDAVIPDGFYALAYFVDTAFVRISGLVTSLGFPTDIRMHHLRGGTLAFGSTVPTPTLYCPLATVLPAPFTWICVPTLSTTTMLNQTFNLTWSIAELVPPIDTFLSLYDPSEHPMSQDINVVPSVCAYVMIGSVTQSAVQMGIYLSIIFIVISALMEVAAVALAPLLRLVRLPVATINAIRSIFMSAQIDAIAMSAADSKATLDEMDRDTIALDARLRALELDRPPNSDGPVASGGGVLADGGGFYEGQEGGGDDSGEDEEGPLLASRGKGGQLLTYPAEPSPANAVLALASGVTRRPPHKGEIGHARNRNPPDFVHMMRLNDVANV